MPLPSVLNGAFQCQVLTKRTKQRCKNPCAFGSKKACRMHGSHKSKNVLRGPDHPNYKHGNRTKDAQAKDADAKCRIAMLEQVGWIINLFIGNKTRGRKPSGYLKLNLNDPEELRLALALILKNNFAN